MVSGPSDKSFLAPESLRSAACLMPTRSWPLGWGQCPCPKGMHTDSLIRGDLQQPGAHPGTLPLHLCTLRTLRSHGDLVALTLCSRRPRFCCCSIRSEAEAGGEAALMFRMTLMLSSGSGGSPRIARFSAFMLCSSSKPPRVHCIRQAWSQVNMSTSPCLCQTRKYL